MQASFPPFLRPNPLYSPAESAESLASRASKIRLLLLDVDGVSPSVVRDAVGDVGDA